MKKILMLFVIGLMFASCSSENTEATAAPTTDTLTAVEVVTPSVATSTAAVDTVK